MSITFLVTAFIVVVTPGTGVVYTLSAALSRGARASVVAALGCTLGIVPQLLATITGVAALLRASPPAFQALKYLGVGYLLVMAWSTLRDRDALRVAGQDTPRSALRVIVSAVLLNVLNPKLTVFFVAFLPQFVSPTEPHSLEHLLALSAVFMLLTFVVFVGYGVCASAARTYLTERPRSLRWLRRIFAGSFVLLGARLALASA